MSGFNYGQPFNSTVLTTTAEFTAVPAPTILEREVQSLIALNNSNTEQLVLEVWKVTSGVYELLERVEVNPGGYYELVDPDQYVLDTTQSVRVNLIEAAADRGLALSARWRDKWEYQTVPNILDYWVHDKGISPVIAADGTRVERWTGQISGLTFDNLLLPGQQPKWHESGGLNGMGYLEFEAARNDYLAMVFGAVKAQPLTIAMVVEWSGADGDYVFDAVDATDRIQFRQNGANMRLDASNGVSPEDIVDAATFKTATLMILEANGATSRLFWEGGADLSTANPGANGMAGITLGGDYAQTASAAADMKIYEMMVVDTATLSNSILDRWGQEMRGKYNRPYSVIV